MLVIWVSLTHVKYDSKLLSKAEAKGRCVAM